MNYLKYSDKSLETWHKVTLMDILSLLSAFVGIASIPIAFLLARRGRQRPKLRYVIDSEVIVSPEDGLLNRGLSMSFAGTTIDKLSKTTIAIWGQRGDTVRGIDIVADDALRVKLGDDDAVLQARVIARSRRQNKVEAIPDPKIPFCVEIIFDFLDQNDGAIIEILHKESKQKPILLGTIRGATLRKARAIELSSSSLKTLAARSRLMKYLSVGLLIISTIMVPAIAVFAISFEKWSRARELSLADANNYELGTPEGQREFALEVIGRVILDPATANGFSIFTITFGAVILLGIFFIATMFFIATHAVIPRNILAIHDRE